MVGGGDREGQPSSYSSSTRKEDSGRESHPAPLSPLALLALVPGMLQAQPPHECPPGSPLSRRWLGPGDPFQGEILGLVWWSRKNEARGDRLTQHFPLDRPAIKDTSETIKGSLNSGGSPHSQPLLTCLQAQGAYHLPWQPILFGERSNS